MKVRKKTLMGCHSAKTCKHFRMTRTDMNKNINRKVVVLVRSTGTVVLYICLTKRVPQCLSSLYSPSSPAPRTCSVAFGLQVATKIKVHSLCRTEV